MRAYTYFLQLVLVLNGCALFKDTVTHQEKVKQQQLTQYKVRSQENKDWLSMSGSMEWSQNADSSRSLVQIWPRGVFTYSPVNGFSGEAERIIVSGERTGVNSTYSTQSAEVHDQGKVSIQQDQMAKVEMQQVGKHRKTVVSWKWVIVVLLLSVLIFVYLKVFKKAD